MPALLLEEEEEEPPRPTVPVTAIATAAAPPIPPTPLRSLPPWWSSLQVERSGAMYRGSLRPPSTLPPPPPAMGTTGGYPLTVNGYPPSVDPLGGPSGNDSELFIPTQRVLAPTGGRNSIRYRNHLPSQNTTKLFYVDNKLSDIDTYNEEANHSNFRTTVIHNQNLDPATAATETIQLDNRSCWGGDLHTSFKTNCPNVTRFFQSDTVRVKLMVSRDPPPAAPQPQQPAPVEERAAAEEEAAEPTAETPAPQPYVAPTNAEYKWYDLTIPEGNYALNEIIDLLNEGVVQLYLQEGRQNNVQRSDIGVKFDTRYLQLLRDPVTGLVTPGAYVNKGFHPDIILLPGCAVDFTYSRLSLILGIGKREPYSKGFTITYEDLEGGQVPALLDVATLTEEQTDVIALDAVQPQWTDAKGVSYNVVPADPTTGTPAYTMYRSWLIAYQTPGTTAQQKTLLTLPDMGGGVGAMYTSMPDTFQPPTGFLDDNTTNLAPVVAMNLFPNFSKAIYVAASSYVQRLENASLSATAAFNRFPENEILKQAPPMNMCAIADNAPSVMQQGTLPVRNSLAGLQRVLVTDDQRRPIPYVYKTVCTVQPRVLSSATLQ